MNTGGERQISETDVKRVRAFQDFITDGTDAAYLRKSLTQVYFSYTRLLAEHPERVHNDTKTELYYLSELIEILE